VVDGNNHQISCLEKEALNVPNITIILDIIHVIEYIYKIMRLLCTEKAQKTQGMILVNKMVELLIIKGYPVMRKYIVDKFKEKERSKNTRVKFNKIIAYFDKKQKYMEYRSFLAHGFPIASGVIEGACRHLVQDRLGITGARWTVKTSEAILKLRSLKSSGDFDEYWKWHLKKEKERKYSRFKENAEEMAA